MGRTSLSHLLASVGRLRVLSATLREANAVEDEIAATLPLLAREAAAELRDAAQRVRASETYDLPDESLFGSARTAG